MEPQQTDAARRPDTHAPGPENPPATLSRVSAAALGLLMVNLVGCPVSAGLTALGMTWPAVAMAVMPLVALVAAVVGFFAIRDASRPGRFGRGPAKLALFVGAIMFVLQSAFVGAAVVTFVHRASTLAPAVDRFVVALETGDLDAAARATALDPDAPETAEDLASWAHAVRGRIGPLRGARFDLGTIRATREAARSLSPASPPGGAAATGPPPPPPNVVEVIGDRGSCIVFIELDEDALTGGRVVIEDLLALLDGGSAAALRRDGPATQIADQFGLTLTSGSP